MLFRSGLTGWLLMRSSNTSSQVGQVRMPETSAFGTQEYLLALMPEPGDARTRSDASVAPVKQAAFGREIGFLQLRLALPQLKAGTYRVEIKDLESKKIVWQDKLVLNAGQAEASLRIARETLPLSDYRLTLFNEESANSAPWQSYRFDLRQP